MPLLTITEPNTNVWLTGDLTNYTPNDAVIVIGPNAHNTRLFITHQVSNYYALGDGDASVGISIQGAARVSIIGLGGYLYGFKYGITTTAPCLATTVRSLDIVGSRVAAISHTGDNLTVRECTIDGVGGVDVFGPEFFFGIRSLGRKPTIVGNVVRNVMAPVWEAVGISSDSQGQYGLISGNRVVNDVVHTGVTPHNLPKSWAFWVGDDVMVEEDLSVTHNMGRNYQVGFAFSGQTMGVLGKTNALFGYEQATILTPANWSPGWSGDL